MKEEKTVNVKGINLNDKLNPKALEQKNDLGQLEGTSRKIDIVDNATPRIRLNPNEIIIKFSIDGTTPMFETSTGNEAPDSLKGLVKTILVVLSKAEGVKELMGLGRKLTR